MIPKFRPDPVTLRRFRRFRSMKRGWYSFLAISFAVFLAALGPLLVGDTALLVRHGGEWRFPLFSDVIPGTAFGLDYSYGTDYRMLREKFAADKSGDFVLMPPIPFSPTGFCEVNAPVRTVRGRLCVDETPILESRVFTLKHDGSRGREWTVRDGLLDGEMRGFDKSGVITERGVWTKGVMKSLRSTDGSQPRPPGEAEMNSLFTYIRNPAPPLAGGHLLGTDESGHDVAARLYGGFRIILAASFFYMTLTYLIGIVVGCLAGYYGGVIDLIAQRLIEIWSNVPGLYLIIFVSSMITPGLFVLTAIIVSTAWMPMTYYVRSGVYREKNREYVNAARLLGAGDGRILFRHILPNTLSTLITFAPFSIVAVAGAITSLDFLGFGLPPTSPSWGNLLEQGKDNFDAWWILASVTTCTVSLMMTVSFVGEAIREAFDPKRHSVYS